MSKSLLGGGAVTAVAILSVSLIFQATPSIAEPLASTAQGQEQSQQAKAAAATVAEAAKESSPESAATDEASERTTDKTGSNPAKEALQNFVATAYSLRGRTASGRTVTRGLIAADRKVLPLGTRVRLEAGSYSGEYVVADTGGAVRGRKIDIWMPSSVEAMRFGRRTVKLTVLTYGGRRADAKATRIRR